MHLSCRVPARAPQHYTAQQQCLSTVTCQVVDKDADAVLDEVEAAIYKVALSILHDNGFSYDIPSRAKSNQL